jgi:hypothetical protein
LAPAGLGIGGRKPPAAKLVTVLAICLSRPTISRSANPCEAEAAVSKTNVTFRVIAVNLDSSGIDEADRVASILRDEGWPRATRSLVIREAIERLGDELREKRPDEIFRYFVERRAKRASDSRRVTTHGRDGGGSSRT